MGWGMHACFCVCIYFCVLSLHAHTLFSFLFSSFLVFCFLISSCFVVLFCFCCMSLHVASFVLVSFLSFLLLLLCFFSSFFLLVNVFLLFSFLFSSSSSSSCLALAYVVWLFFIWVCIILIALSQKNIENWISCLLKMKNCEIMMSKYEKTRKLRWNKKI